MDGTETVPYLVGGGAVGVEETPVAEGVGEVERAGVGEAKASVILHTWLRIKIKAISILIRTAPILVLVLVLFMSLCLRHCLWL